MSPGSACPSRSATARIETPAPIKSDACTCASSRETTCRPERRARVTAKRQTSPTRVLRRRPAGRRREQQFDPGPTPKCSMCLASASATVRGERHRPIRRLRFWRRDRGRLATDLDELLSDVEPTSEEIDLGEREPECLSLTQSRSRGPLDIGTTSRRRDSRPRPGESRLRRGNLLRPRGLRCPRSA